MTTRTPDRTGRRDRSTQRRNQGQTTTTLSPADRRRLLRRLETLRNLDRLMQQAGGMPSIGEPLPLHRLATVRPSPQRTP